MVGVKVLKRLHKAGNILTIKCAMFEICKAIKVGLGEVLNEIVRCVVHQFSKLRSIVDDGFSLAPSNRSSEKGDDLNVFFFAVAVRNADGIRFDKVGTVELVVFLIEKRLQFGGSQTHLETKG